MLIFNFLITGIYLIVTYEELSTCLFGDVDTSCKNLGLIMIEAIKSDLIIEILFLINICVLAITKYLFSIFVIRSYTISQENRIAPNQYTLMIKLSKVEIETPSEIEKAVHETINKNKKPTEPEIRFLKINPIYDIKEFVFVTRKLLIMEKKMHIAVSKGKKIEKIILKKAELKAKLDEIKESMKDNINKQFTGWVFVTFEKIETAVYVSKINRTFSNALLFWKKAYNFRRAPEPSDIIWENWSMSYNKRLLRRIFGLILAFIFIACNFGIIIGIKWGQTYINLKNVPNQVALYFISIAISLIIASVSIIIRFILYRSNKHENYRTHSAAYTVIAMKITIANFLNIVLIVLIANRVIGTLNDNWNIFGSAGTMGNIIIIMIVNVFADALLFIFDPFHLLKNFRKKVMKYQIDKKSTSVLQCEANEIFEGDSVDLAELYYSAFKTITIAFFYQLIIPYGLLLAIIELIFKYWVFKYVIVKRSKRTVDYLLDFSINMIKIFEFMIFLLALGFFVFKVIFVGWEIFARPVVIVILVVACYELLVGIKLFKRCYERQFKSKNQLQFRTFSENIVNFIYDYDRMNPITQKIAYEQYVKDLQKPPSQVKEQTPLHIDPSLFLDGLKDYAVITNNDTLRENRVYKADIPLHGPGEDAFYQAGSVPIECQQPSIYEILNISNIYFARRKIKAQPEIRKNNLNSNENQSLQPEYTINELREDANPVTKDDQLDARQEYINFLAESIVPILKKPDPKDDNDIP